jgi:hypothetical protein
MAELQEKLGARLGASGASAAFLEHRGRRRALLSRLSALAAPTTEEEREALARMNGRRGSCGQAMAR